MISFPIPLSAAVPAHYVAPGGEPTEECPGSISQPAAAPGNLCFYKGSGFLNGSVEVKEGNVYDPESNTLTKAGKGGAALRFSGLETGKYGNGVWVVTAP